MKHRRFGHKPWTSSANAEGHVTRMDYVTGDEESASVLILRGKYDLQAKNERKIFYHFCHF